MKNFRVLTDCKAIGDTLNNKDLRKEVELASILEDIESFRSLLEFPVVEFVCREFNVEAHHLVVQSWISKLEFSGPFRCRDFTSPISFKGLCT